MKSKIIFIVFGLLVLFMNSCTDDDVNPELKADFDVTYRSEFQSTIYPSMIFGLTEIEKQEDKPMDYFTITVNLNIETDIKIIIQESKLNFETIITESHVKGEKKITPSLKWKYDDLKNLTEAGIVDLTFVCYGDENIEIGRKDLKLSYREINECVYAAQIDGQVLPLWWMFAEYVNEDSPIIDNFLKDVLLTTDLTGFTGYQSGEEGVIEQVYAIYSTLRAKGIKYSSITSTSNTNSNIKSQYIRFSDEVLVNTQANCADGTVFFCSVLKKIGIHTIMVFVPGHVYLGYYSDDLMTNLRLLETTMIGLTNSDFYDASTYQIDAFNSNLDMFNNSDYFDGYFIIDIDKARQIIKPIGR